MRGDVISMFSGFGVGGRLRGSEGPEVWAFGAFWDLVRPLFSVAEIFVRGNGCDTAGFFLPKSDLKKPRMASIGDLRRLVR